MGEMLLAAPLAGLAEKNRITASDVRMMRQMIFRDGLVARGEAETLFALEEVVRDKCPEWGVFLVEAVSDYVVHQEFPAGYVSNENVAWLKSAVSRDGVVYTETELELLIAVMEKARHVPPSLASYTLEQVADAVIEGRGPLASGGSLTPGMVSRAEVELLRRILYAAGGEQNVGISRAEAEILFRINDRTAEARNDPSWSELFVKATANHVLCASGYEAPSRAEALRRDAFFDDASADIAGFFRRMVAGGAAGILDAYSKPDGIEAAFAERNAGAADAGAAAAPVDAKEARWLVEKITGDRTLHQNERELLAFLKRESPSIHPDLKPLLDKVA